MWTPRRRETKAIYLTLFAPIAPIAPLSVCFASFRLHMHMKNLTRTRIWCIFILWEHNWGHNCIHHSLQLVNCTCNSLLFICPAWSKHLCFQPLLTFFEKNASCPRWEAHFLKLHVQPTPFSCPACSKHLLSSTCAHCFVKCFLSSVGCTFFKIRP